MYDLLPVLYHEELQRLLPKVAVFFEVEIHLHTRTWRIVREVSSFYHCGGTVSRQAYATTVGIEERLCIGGQLRHRLTCVLPKALRPSQVMRLTALG